MAKENLLVRVLGSCEIMAKHITLHCCPRSTSCLRSQPCVLDSLGLVVCVFIQIIPSIVSFKFNTQIRRFFFYLVRLSLFIVLPTN
jgi:hypothetical protein